MFDVLRRLVRVSVVVVGRVMVVLARVNGRGRVRLRRRRRLVRLDGFVGRSRRFNGHGFSRSIVRPMDGAYWSVVLIVVIVFAVIAVLVAIFRG